MEYSRYEAPDCGPPEDNATQTSSAITWLLVGIGIGAGMALLLAPTSGRELRGTIGRGFGRTLSGLSRGTQQLRRRGSNLLNFNRSRSSAAL